MSALTKQMRAIVRNGRLVVGDGTGGPPSSPRCSHPLPYYIREWDFPIAGFCFPTSPSTCTSQLDSRYYYNPGNQISETCHYSHAGDAALCAYISFPGSVGFEAQARNSTQTCNARSRSPQTGGRYDEYTAQPNLIITMTPAYPITFLSPFPPFPVVGTLTNIPLWPKYIACSISDVVVTDGGHPYKAMLEAHAPGNYILRFSHVFAAGAQLPLFSGTNAIPWYGDWLNGRLYKWGQVISPSPHAPSNPNSRMLIYAMWHGHEIAHPSIEPENPLTWSVNVRFSDATTPPTGARWWIRGPAEARQYLQGTQTITQDTSYVYAGSATLTPVY